MEKRYIYRGNAVAAAGHIIEPDNRIIPVQASSSLPVIGGYARSITSRLEVGEIVSLDGTSTHATGAYNEKDRTFRTLVSATASGLNVEKRVTAHLFEAMLTSIHPESGGQPSISPRGTRIEDFRIDGYPVTVTLDIDVFSKFDTKEKLQRAYASDDAFYKSYEHRFVSAESPSAAGGKREIPEVGGYIFCSLVAEIHCDHPQLKIDDNVIQVPDFGSIFLGEFLITAVSRRLTLVRMELGSPEKGKLALSEVESNGQTLP